MSPIVVLIILIVIANVIRNVSQAPKGGRKNGAVPRKPVQRVPVRTVPPEPSEQKPAAVPAEPMPAAPEKIRQIPRDDSVQKAAEVIRKPAEQDYAGSLGGGSTEGETPEEHARHELRRAASIAAGTAPTTSRRIGVSELRRAVVMSEILDKPKALRR